MEGGKQFKMWGGGADTWKGAELFPDLLLKTLRPLLLQHFFPPSWIARLDANPIRTEIEGENCF